MALALYYEPTEEAAISTDGTLPLTFTFMGRIGGAIAKKIYIRNDNLERYYTNIVVSPVNTTHSWKLLESDSEPTLEEWARIPGGTAVSLSDGIGTSTKGDIGTYLSFWVQVAVLPEQPASTVKDVKLRISATEGLVT